MIASPPIVFDPLTRAATKFAIFMGDDTGAFSTALTDRVDHLLPLTIQWGTGSKGSPVATLVVDLAAAGWRFQDTITPVGHNRIIEIRRIDENGGVDDLVFWGKLESQGQAAGESVESLSVIASPRTLFRGEGLLTQPVYDGVTATVVNVAREWVFNPEIDGINEPNRSDERDNISVFHRPHYFADPESFRTVRSQDAQGSERAFWTLAQAVHRLCWSMNPDETYFKNPDYIDCDVYIGDSADKLFRNHRLKMTGITIETALDELLHPYGITWFWEVSGDLGNVETHIKFAKLGDGSSVDLRLQRINDSIDANQTNVSDVSIEYDVVSHPNVIVGYSAPIKVEVSLRLTPGWDPQYDDADLIEINKPETPRDVGRKWIVNEAGDYNGWRPSQLLVGKLLNGDVDWVLVSKRRQFQQMLTLGDDKQPLGDNGFTLRKNEGDSTTKLVDYKGSFEVLKHELGVMLETRLLPPYADRILEITGVIELDERVVARAERREESPNGAELVLPIDLSHRFQRSLVLSDSDPDAVSRYYTARHCTLQQVTAGVAGSATLKMSRDVSDDLKPGQRIAVVAHRANTGADDSTPTRWEGTYTAKTIATDTVTIREEIIDSQTANFDQTLGWVGLNTDEVDCLWRLPEYVEKLRDEQDYAVVAVDVTLPGVDHVAYKLGDIVTGLQPRNVTLDAYKGGTSRRPQITSITLELNGRQTTRLGLEQHFPPIDKAEATRDAAI